jgi:hypothetical protein
VLFAEDDQMIRALASSLQSSFPSGYTFSLTRQPAGFSTGVGCHGRETAFTLLLRLPRRRWRMRTVDGRHHWRAWGNRWR